MASMTEVRVPDIGDFDDVPVIEILVKPGDRVRAEDPLITLESDKATMDVPSPADGVVGEIRVAVGDKVSEGTVIALLDDGADGTAATSPKAAAPANGNAAESARAVAEESPAERPATAKAPAPESKAEIEVTVPDIGDFSDVPVIEILVAVGDTVAAEQPLVTLESDKATMDVPSPVAGVVGAIRVAVGDTVSEGSPIATIATESAAPAPAPAEPARTPAKAAAPEPPPTAARSSARDAEATPPSGSMEPRGPGRPSPTAGLGELPGPKAPSAHASPAIRRFARELGVELTEVTGTGRKGRILTEDVQRHVKARLTGASTPAAPAATGTGIPPIPAVDFGKFGDIETQPLGRIKRISGPHLQRAWLNVPHVTHHDEADVTEMEAFRRALKDEAEKRGVRLTPLAFVMKALVACLREFPTFNASLTADGEALVLKKYFHLGVAVDTPQGLVVPVIRDVDTKGIYDLARELGEVSLRAREGKLKPAELQGGCMSISSLGGIGGVGFTPIVNAPEVAILGLTRARMAPVWDGKAFVPRLMQPLDLSYDHRVIDGAEAARFVAHLARLLGDVRRLLL
ncbi:MAG: dihydrolipoyllysine-residue acetyltransferase [Ectothiorhodospiraceae bacterium]|nr:dihydrolipoyllysine-residue acetyltransferase [Chromatiales bacterium]MCP5153974.1 dihydrolipoyllysine-residue acetyltransferase [Ectothiorhodospiraceae bacterium]